MQRTIQDCTGEKGLLQITSYLPEDHRETTSYLLEDLRQISSYFPEDLRQISSYLPEDLWQITSSKTLSLKTFCTAAVSVECILVNARILLMKTMIAVMLNCSCNRPLHLLHLLKNQPYFFHHQALDLSLGHHLLHHLVWSVEE